MLGDSLDKQINDAIAYERSFLVKTVGIKNLAHVAL